MTTAKITKKIVDAAEPKASRYVIFDTAVPGFGVRVYPSGAKSWIFEYRGGSGGRTADKQRMTIGRTADFTADQARAIADDLRAAVRG